MWFLTLYLTFGLGLYALFIILGRENPEVFIKSEKDEEMYASMITHPYKWMFLLTITGGLIFIIVLIDVYILRRK